MTRTVLGKKKVTRGGCSLHARGFTFVEMMIVLAIMTILSTMLVWNYQTTFDQRAASDAVQKARLALREAEIWANSSRPFPLDAPSTDSDRYDRGFGIYIKPSSVGNRLVLYGGSGTGESSTDSSYSPLRAINEMELPQGSAIKSLCRINTDTHNMSDCFIHGTSDYLTLFFRRPSAAPIINESYDFDHARITVGAADTADYDWTIEVHQSGRIELIRP